MRGTEVGIITSDPGSGTETIEGCGGLTCGDGGTVFIEGNGGITGDDVGI